MIFKKERERKMNNWLWTSKLVIEHPVVRNEKEVEKIQLELSMKFESLFVTDVSEKGTLIRMSVFHLNHGIFLGLFHEIHQINPCLIK